jgi:hypothetical protein
MDQDWYIDGWKAEQVYTHVRVATFRCGAFNSLTVTMWRTWHPGPGWRMLWWWWRCTHAFAPQVCLWMLWCAILARKAAVCLIFTNHGRASFYPSLHLVIPRTQNSLLHPFSDIAASFLD